MPKLILSASLLLILEISIAQSANDGNKNIIAPYAACFKGLGAKGSLTKPKNVVHSRQGLWKMT
jgi:hypothetical protein